MFRLQPCTQLPHLINHDVYVAKWFEALIVVSRLIGAEQLLLKQNKKHFCVQLAMRPAPAAMQWLSMMLEH